MPRKKHMLQGLALFGAAAFLIAAECSSRTAQRIPVHIVSAAEFDAWVARNQQLHTVNLNTATADELEALPGIGAARAEAILAYRAEVGAFHSVEDLLAVSGIGAARLDALRPYVTVEPNASSAANQ